MQRGQIIHLRHDVTLKERALIMSYLLFLVGPSVPSGPSVPVQLLP